MFVCLCNAVTDRQIRAAARKGACTLEELRRVTGCGDCCGCCVDTAEAILAIELSPARNADHGLIPIRAAA